MALRCHLLLLLLLLHWLLFYAGFHPWAASRAPLHEAQYLMVAQICGVVV
jgi:hypothetical protein